MAETVKLTKVVLDKIAAPEKGKRTYILDTKVNGLGLSVTDKGTKSFYVVRRIGGNTKRVTLGRYPDMTIDQARNHAAKTLSVIADGIDPIDQKREQRAAKITLRDAFEDYLKSRKNLKVGTIYDYKKTIQQTFDDWLDKPLASITKDKVRARHDKRSKESKARADNAFRVLRAVFNFAEEVYEDSKGNSLFSNNPVTVLSKTKAWNNVGRKNTYITKDDLPKWFNSVMDMGGESDLGNASVIKVYLLFILFTGARREETARLLWSDVDLDAGIFTLRDTKNGTDITLPMSSFLRDLMSDHKKSVKSKFVFAGADEKKHIVSPSKQLARVTQDSGVSFTLHDLRRTFLTIANGLDISSYTLKRLVNHKTGEKTDVTAGYIILDPERLRVASQRVTGEILNIVGFDMSESVVQLKLVK